MEEHYKDAIILITTGPAERISRWKATCEIKFLRGGRNVIKELKLDLDYDTVEHAERASLVFAKKWVDLKL